MVSCAVTTTCGCGGLRIGDGSVIFTDS